MNDFHEFHFPSLEWSPVTTIGVIPSPRDRHVAFVWNKSFYIFGGFDGKLLHNIHTPIYFRVPS